MKTSTHVVLALVMVIFSGVLLTQASAASEGGEMSLAANPYSSISLKTGFESFLAGEILQGPLYDRPTRSAESDLVFPEDINPPEACGVTVRSPFGRDVEIFVGPWNAAGASVMMDQAPVWHADEALPGSPGSNMVAVPLGSERAVTVWKEGTQLKYSVWEASGEDGGAPGKWGVARVITNTTGISPQGNPAVIPLAADAFEVYARFGNQIAYIDIWLPVAGFDPQYSPWFVVDGITNAASDPAVISLTPKHTIVFYTGLDGHVWYTEWIGDATGEGVGQMGDWRSPQAERIPVWREEPLSLYGQFPITYMPLMFQGSTTPPTGPSSRAETSQGIIRDPGMMASPLSAISRHINHAAVFGVDVDGFLWVKEWTSDNDSTWRDTQWVKLKEGVMIQKPAVASMHSNHLAVAVKTGSMEPFYIEWVPEQEWQDPVSLSSLMLSPLSLAATSTDSISVFGISFGRIYEKVWSESGGWGSWQQLSDGIYREGQTLATVVRRMHDVMVVGRSLSGSAYYRHYTSQGQALAQSGLNTPSVKGYGRGQALPWVDGHVLWAALQENQAADHWQLTAYDIPAGGEHLLALDDHPYAPGSVVSLAKGDLDLNGSDELVVGTHLPGTLETQLSVINYVITPTLAGAVIDTLAISGTQAMGDVSLAVGDLDGDRVDNEIVIGSFVPGMSKIRLDVYHYLTETQELAPLLAYPLYINYTAGLNGENELELATGYLYSDYGSLCADKMLIVLLDTARTPDLQVSARLRTYCLYEDGTWQLQLSDDDTQTGALSQPITWSLYHSDIETDDLDVDGYDEVVFSFANKVVKFDSNYPSGDSHRVVFYEDPNSIHTERSLGVGDFDRDGRGEIAFIFNPVLALRTLEVNPDGSLRVDGAPTNLATGMGTVLVGDLDNDTYIAELAGCYTFHDPTVQVVVNGAPRWYENGSPIHKTTASFSKTVSGGSGTENGRTQRFGGGISLGFKLKAPGTVTEFRASLGYDILGTWGYKERTEITDVYGTTLEYSGFNLGLVVYTDSIYACYYYNLYHPTNPQNNSQMMTCFPLSDQAESYIKTIDDWNSEAWKSQTGSAWVEVGHKHPRTGEHSNDVGLPGNYPRTLPVTDPQKLLFEPGLHTPIPWGLIVQPGDEGLKATWWGEQLTKTLRLELGETSNTFTFATGAVVGGPVFGGTVDFRMTYGFTDIMNSVTSWGDSVKFSGGVNMFDADRPCYKIVPYVWQAEAETVAGTTYDYWEADYYVPVKPWACARSTEQASQEQNQPR